MGASEEGSRVSTCRDLQDLFLQRRLSQRGWEDSAYRVKETLYTLVLE